MTQIFTTSLRRRPFSKMKVVLIAV